MNKTLTTLGSLGLLLLAHAGAHGQITVLKNYTNYSSAPIGTVQGVPVREGGFSGLRYIPGTDGKEFWVCSDRGANIDAGNANSSGCRPTYDKIYPFPAYAPKIHRIKVKGDSIQILRTITVKRPNGTGATGIINPTGLGSTAAEVASTDTVLNCANFNSKTVAKDTFGIDCEGIIVDRDGYFWLCEEGGPTIWKLDQNGKVVKRYTPYYNLGGTQSVDAPIDTVFKYRKNNRGFESLTIAPNGKIYAIIQSPLLYPTKSVGENTKIHRILEIDPATNAMRQFAYLNDGVTGSGSNQIRLRDWKVGDMTAINDTTFLVLEAAARGNTDIKRLYRISINGATAVTSGLYNGATLEALADETGLANNNIVPVTKTLAIDLLANGWPAALDKAEGVTIIDDSTIAIVNDNDYGLVSANEDGIVASNGNACHMLVYRLSGSNKLVNYVPYNTTYSQGITGINSSQAPYLTPTQANVWFKSILTTGDQVNGYTMAGTPDGLGAYDNGDGTFTLVMNHEFGNTAGATHAHGATGSFISRWVINKSDLSVVSGEDLMKKVFLWNTATNSYVGYNSTFPSTAASFGRFCSADMPALSAFYNSITGNGTQERIFMNGEETGAEGRGMAHIVTGPNAGTSYELPKFGKFSWENSVANPATGDKTVVAGMDDATPGQVYFYIGTKTNSGNEIEKAGLTNGKLYSPSVTGMTIETNSSSTAPATFTMIDLGNVQNLTGAQLETNSNNLGVTRFLRPEDGAWDPVHPNDFYFATTNGIGSPSRLWKLHFSDLNDLTQGGTITAVLNGTEGQEMLDNLTIDNSGHVLLVEDVGGNARLGRVWQYDINTDALKQIGSHDSTRFLNGSANFLTQDEEASGILDVQSILGPGMFLTVDQAHYSLPSPLVEGGQLLAFFNPDTYNGNPEIDVQGNNISIADGDVTPAATDNTDFGSVNKMTTVTKSFTIKNAGPGNLIVSDIAITGAFASDFTVMNAALPMTIAANGSQTINVQFMPASTGVHTATMRISNNDNSENVYDFMLQGTGTEPKITVQGNNATITDGDMTAGGANNTDFGNVKSGSSKENTFIIQNKGTGALTISAINFGGMNATDFTLSNAPTFPMTVTAGGSQSVTVKFAPSALGVRNATINIVNDDPAVGTYDFALEGTGVDPTGIATISGLSAIKLFPNPASNSVTLSLMLKKDMQVSVNVYDIQGKEVMQGVQKMMNAGEQQVTLNTSSLNNGVYFVQITSGGLSTKMKMVINH